LIVSPYAGSGTSGSSYVFSVVVIAEEVNGVREKESVDGITVDVQTSFEVLPSVCMGNSAFNGWIFIKFDT
jgi:hypothetical protein